MNGGQPTRADLIQRPPRHATPVVVHTITQHRRDTARLIGAITLSFLLMALAIGADLGRWFA